jgi:hypothetical protein
MQEFMMNQSKDSVTGVIVHPVPLFASSWIALFCFLKDSLGQSRMDTEQPAEKDRKGGTGHTRH